MNAWTEAREAPGLEAVAARLRAQGYEVAISPQPERLPAFLRQFSPDVLARRGDENLVVEVKRRHAGKSGAEIGRLAEIVSEHPGWRFELVLVGSDDPAWNPPDHLPEPSTIAKELAHAERIASSGSANAALLLLWSLFEGAARHRLAARGIDPSERLTPPTIVERLIYEGDLDDDDDKRLRAALELRNSVAHGFVDQQPDTAVLDSLAAITRKLLEPLARAA